MAGGPVRVVGPAKRGKRGSLGGCGRSPGKRSCTPEAWERYGGYEVRLGVRGIRPAGAVVQPLSIIRYRSDSDDGRRVSGTTDAARQSWNKPGRHPRRTRERA